MKNRDFFTDENSNLLPFDGTVYYYPGFLDSKHSKSYFNALSHNINWQQDEVIIFGRHIITRRKTAWYADKPYAYTYSKITRYATKWTPELIALKALIEARTGQKYNACLLNYYHDGDDGMSWHSDVEPTLEPLSAIASISLGAERNFRFKHKNSGETRGIGLEDGSLLLMQDQTQLHWLHALPKSKRIDAPRINLTFRKMKQQAL